ncbi:TPA: LlaJI family restriction endonuclease [Yersinia enterocolitica]|nr:LlaJI family restriction endonuclease [Yersinia enterocolitica]EKN4817745.1 LlaJI family restriction endonuclease [Yersinia enterocolitica]EKN4835040.1 LlaJI family restriction endonuclease [Yersinia enterocolitica]CNK67551.1 LlaJI restriction endonuclease [Yersinia enterocolitica]HDL7338457.1 LlaJI family restriction endonuclease [Yersinia enterocolitica]
MSKIQFFMDRTIIDTLPDTLVSTMKSQGLIIQGSLKIHFCGFVSYREGIAVFLPRKHNCISKQELYRASHYLMQALHRYYADKETSILDEDGDTIIGGQSLALIGQLFDDYVANGLYVRRTTERSKHSGKINWFRTIVRSTCYPSKGKPVYLDLETSRTRYMANCETAKIHARVLREIYKHYGLLWFGEHQYIKEKLKLIASPQGDIEVQLSHLKNELSLSYSDRDMVLINTLIQYLQFVKGDLAQKFVMGTNKFHHIWESMLCETLPNVYPINRQLPIPVYQTEGGHFVPMAQKGQRTDIFLKSPCGLHFAIVDAKYYDASSPATAPGWPDLVKQFFYRDAVKSVVGEDAQITNHFIFPGTEQKLKTVHVARRGMSVIDESDFLASYPAIQCHYQDPIELLEKYIRFEKLTVLGDILLS